MGKEYLKMEMIIELSEQKLRNKFMYDDLWSMSLDLFTSHV